VDITVQDRVLTISGERKVEQEEKRGGYFVRERRHGSFRRSMTLPEGVEEDSIRARFEDGVLEVTLQGAAAIREPRRIQIESSGGESTGTPNISSEGPSTEGPESPGGTAR
jgi:HSP20 family protein